MLKLTMKIVKPEGIHATTVLGELRQEGQQFKVIMGYIVSTRPHQDQA